MLDDDADKPFLTVQSYVEHMKKQQINLQETIRSLKSKVDALERKNPSVGDQTKEIIDMNLKLKQDLAMVREEKDRLRKEWEQMQARVRTLDPQVGQLCISMKKACLAIRNDAERLHTSDQQIQRNILGAAVFCLQEIDQFSVHFPSVSQKRPFNPNAYY